MTIMEQFQQSASADQRLRMVELRVKLLEIILTREDARNDGDDMEVRKQMQSLMREAGVIGF
jgi:hypothetical protein